MLHRLVFPTPFQTVKVPVSNNKRAEIRVTVEELVRRVVPEEIDNIDEMMLQFKGREEELVETLRTMEERAVAQKARAQGHKAAKREARNTVQQGGVELPVPGTTEASERRTSCDRSCRRCSGHCSCVGRVQLVSRLAPRRRKTRSIVIWRILLLVEAMLRYWCMKTRASRGIRKYFRGK